MGNFSIFKIFETLRRGRQARKFECSEKARSQIVFRTDSFRKLALGASECVELNRMLDQTK